MHAAKNPFLPALVGFGALFLLYCFLPPTLFAQTIGASISGTVTDQTGAVLPGAKVTAKNPDTGITHSAPTDALGLYRFAGLALGTYEVKVEMAGFTTEVRSGITLTVAQQAVIDFALKVGEVAAQVTVAGDAPLVEQTTSMISGLVDEKKIRDLPLNGRDYTQLALLQPGVTATVTAGPNPFTTGDRIAKFSVNGVRPTANNFLLDGNEINDPSFNVPVGGAAGLALGVEAIREFRILTNTYTAEFGRNAGSLVDAVSKSGTNEFHGSAFEFLRNSALDARNFFDLPRPEARRRGLPEIPPFKRNQFGGSLGGPVVKDKTFFFGTYEGLRERLGVTTVATVPDENARQGILPIRDPQTGELKPTNVGVASGVKPFLDLYPLPNARRNPDGTAEFRGSASQPTDEDYFVAKIDHHFSSHDSLWGRYTFDDSRATVPFGSTPVPGFPQLLSRRNQFATLQEQRIFTPTLLNEFRFGFSRIRQTLFPAGNSPVSIALLPGAQPLGTIALAGVSPLGYTSVTPIGSITNLFQTIDNVSYNRGRHSLKAGADIRRIQINNFFEGNLLGNYNVGSLRNFLEGKSVFYQGVPAGGTSRRGWRQIQFAFFLQDDIRVTKTLTLNAGVRYEFITVPTEVNGRITNLRNPTTDKDITVGPPLFENPSLRNVAPRAGFAWNAFGDGKTVLRGGFGIFFDHIWENIYGNTRFQPPFFTILFVPNSPFPRPSVTGVSVVAPQAIDFHIKNPYVMQYNFNLQRELTRDMMVTVGYVGSRGVKLVRVFEANTNVPTILAGTKFFPPTARRKNPNFGTIRQRAADANSNYNSLQVGFNRRFSRGLQLQASYTLGKFIDDSDGPFQTDSVAAPSNTMDPEDRRRDRALSVFDVRHNFVLNYTYDLPFGPGQRLGRGLSGAAGKLAQGWQVSGITTATSGRPFTVVLAANRSNNGQSGTGIADRPNVLPGFSANPTGGASAGCAGIPMGERLHTPDRWFDPCAFGFPDAGFLGNVGRNTLTGPDFQNFDFSIVKNTSIGESKVIQFRTEFFNLFNRANFQVPTNVGTVAGASSGGDFVFDATGARAGNAGRIFKTVTTSRQIQFALKLIF